MSEIARKQRHTLNLLKTIGVVTILAVMAATVFFSTKSYEIAESAWRQQAEDQAQQAMALWSNWLEHQEDLMVSVVLAHEISSEITNDEYASMVEYLEYSREQVRTLSIARLALDADGGIWVEESSIIHQGFEPGVKLNHMPQIVALTDVLTESEGSVLSDPLSLSDGSLRYALGRVIDKGGEREQINFIVSLVDIEGLLRSLMATELSEGLFLEASFRALNGRKFIPVLHSSSDTGPAKHRFSIRVLSLGTEWTFDWELSEAFQSGPDLANFQLVLFSGISLTLVVAILGSLLIRELDRLNQVSEQRREAIETISQQKLEQELILDTMLDAVFTVGQEGTILTANRSAHRLFNCSKADLIGENFNLLMQEQAQSFHERFQSDHPMTAVSGYEWEVNAVKKNGEGFPARLSFADLGETGSHHRHFTLTLHDLTEEHKQRLQIQRTQKMDALGKLTGGIAHDFNNILSIIAGYTELLLTVLDNQEKPSKHLTEIAKATNRAAALIKKMRSFSTKESSPQKTVYINVVLQEQRLMIEKALTSKNQVEMDLGDHIWPIRVDESELESAILNLSINSMHAMPEGGVLSFKTCNQVLDRRTAEALEITAGDYVYFSVRDTGIGMNRSTQEKAFEPFFSTKGAVGTGLGLSQVYGFVSRSSGGIHLYSEPGQGTELKLYFPKGDIQTDEPQPQDPGDVHKPTGTDRILVVDDENSLREMIAEKLNSSGYIVFQARNGVEALQLLECETVSLVLTDMIMPEMGGAELSNEINLRYPAVKIQLMSGFSDSMQVSLVDPNLYLNRLVKPFGFTLLLTRFRELLGDT